MLLSLCLANISFKTSNKMNFSLSVCVLVSCIDGHRIQLYSSEFFIAYNRKDVTHSMVQDTLWKADSHSACQTVACFLDGTQRFITMLTEAHNWTPSWASRIQFSPSIPINPVNTSPLPHACYMSHPPHPPRFNYPNNIRWRIQAMNFIIIQFSARSVFVIFR